MKLLCRGPGQDPVNKKGAGRNVCNRSFYLINTEINRKYKKFAHSLFYVRCPPARTTRGSCRLQSGGHSILPSIGVTACLFSWLRRLGLAALGCEFCQPDFQGDHFFTHRSPGGGRVHCITLINRWSQFNLLATELGRFYLVTPGPRGERRHRKALHQPRPYDPLMNLQEQERESQRKRKLYLFQ